MAAAVRPRMALAIEVSQREGGVALAPVHATIDARTKESRRIDAGTSGAGVIEIPVGPPDHTTDRLMPAIDAAFRAAGAEPQDLEVIMVSIGPGGFTGLRMAVATAKALSMGTGCAIVAVPSALVAAATMNALQPTPRMTFVALACKGADAWISVVRSDADGSTLVRSALMDAAAFERCARESMADARSDGTSDGATGAGATIAGATGGGTARAILVCDEHLPEEIARAAQTLGIPRGPLSLSARACLHEGRVLLARGGVIDADALTPLYPREPEAVRLWRERHATPRTGPAFGAPE